MATISLKKIFINSIWFGVVPKISSLVNIVLLPFITPYLTSFDYGIWGLITAYTGIVTSVCSLGLHMHLTNSYYEYKSFYYLVWQRISFIIHLSTILFSIILFAFFLVVLNEIALYNRIVLSLLGIFPVLFYTNTLVAAHFYPLRSLPKPMVIRNLISGLCGVLVLYISVYFFRLGYWGFVYGAAATSVVGYILYVYPLWIIGRLIPVWSRKWDRTINWIKVALPVIPHTLGFVLLSSSSRIIMSFYGIPLSEIGLFSNGYMVGDYVTILTTALVTSLMPKMQELYRNRQYLNYRYLFYICQTVSLLFICVFSIWMSDLYSILIRSNELQVAQSIAKYTCFANAILPFYLFTSNIVFIEKDTKQLLWLIFIPGILNVTLNLIFIPIYGYKVAIVIALISYWSQLLIPLYVKYYGFLTKKWFGSIYKLFVLLFIMSFSLLIPMLLANCSFFLKLIVSLFMIVAALGFVYKMKSLIK